jgi:hypothetical protein
VRTLIAVASGLAFLSLAPQCDADLGNDWMPVVTMCSGPGCNGFETYAFAGSCYDGVVSSLQPPAQDPFGTDGQTSECVDVYLKACTGYVPMQMAMAAGRD